MRAVAALVALVALSSGCAADERVCTLIGAPTGLGVTVERSVAADLSSLRLTVCSGDACETRSVSLAPGSDTVDQGCTGPDPDDSCSASASPNGTLTGFVELEELAVGPLRVSGTAVLAGRARRLAETTVTAALVYPNGPDCGGLGPQAQVRLGPAGLR